MRVTAEQLQSFYLGWWKHFGSKYWWWLHNIMCYKCHWTVHFKMVKMAHFMLSVHIFYHNKRRGDFPGGAVVENLPANAGDTGLSPGLGRSHVPRSSWAREPQLLSLRIWSLCSATREAAIVRGLHTAMKSGPHLPQLEKALAQKWRPNTAINK